MLLFARTLQQFGTKENISFLPPKKYGRLFTAPEVLPLVGRGWHNPVRKVLG